MTTKKRGQRVFRGLKYLSIFLLLAIASSTLYYLNEIRLARVQTPALVSTAQMSYFKAASIAKLTPAQLQILLAIEDPKFYSHHGVDLATPGAGMTTITQGLVKLLYYPEGFKQGIAKIRQTLIAQYALDDLVDKETQLELFLNLAYFGHEQNHEVKGFAPAAQIYFHKDLSDLHESKFIGLVAMLIAPNKFKPGTAAHTERVQRIQAYLAGTYQAQSLLDTQYNGTQRGSLSEEALVAFLRLITD